MSGTGAGRGHKPQPYAGDACFSTSKYCKKARSGSSGCSMVKPSYSDSSSCPPFTGASNSRTSLIFALINKSMSSGSSMEYRGLSR